MVKELAGLKGHDCPKDWATDIFTWQLALTQSVDHYIQFPQVLTRDGSLSHSIVLESHNAGFRHR